VNEMALEHPDTLSRTKALWSAKRGRPVSDAQAADGQVCESARVLQNEDARCLEIVEDERQPDQARLTTFPPTPMPSAQSSLTP